MMPEQEKKRILVVDDTEAMRYATSRILRAAGYSVAEAATGLEALEQARRLPELVVLDIHLPDIDGYEVCRRLKADAATASIPVLHLTATYHESEDRSVSLEGGADAFLREPVEPRELLATVGALLRMKKAEDEARQATCEIRKLNLELEDRVAHRTADVVARTKEMETFSYSVSHDLRAPLRAIDGFSALLEGALAGRLDEEERHLLSVIRTNTKRMGRLIDDLLAFSRTARGDLKPSRVESEPLVREVLADVLGPGGGPGVEVRVGPLPDAFADRALLRQVWMNLLSNAVKFSATRQAPLVEVRGREEGGVTLFEVEDNGVGFDMKYVEKLFGVFQRLHGKEFEGTGIGLALVQRIVARHGGSVWASSGPQGGATFSFALPLGTRPVPA